MIHNNLISSNTVIAKVISDLSIPENKLPISDVKEWIGEALLKIGAIQQYEHKVIVLPVTAHQVKLPCDLYKLGQVAFSFQDNCGWLPVRRTTSSFGLYHDKCKGKPSMLIQDIALLPLVKNLFNLTSDKDALEKLNGDQNMRNTLSALLNQYTFNHRDGRITHSHMDGTMYSIDLQYSTKPGYLMINVPEGFVKISYSAIYTDDDGMPMIPDMESYKEAIFWYVTMKLMYSKYLKGDLNQSQYYDIRRSWNFYCKQAYAEAMMPDEGEIESIKNDWNKLYPEMDEYDNFFSTVGQEQYIYNQNR